MITNQYLNRITAVLMAVAVVITGTVWVWTQSDGFVSTGTHFDYEGSLFGENTVATIDIQVDEADWEELLTNATDKEYISADITINGKTVSNVGIRAKGNTSLSQVASDDTTDRYSFKVEFDHYITDQTYDGLDKLALNNIISDATYMKEYLSYQMLESIGVVTPLYGFANITVNGEPWGLYFSVEVLEESFAQRNYGSDYGKLYKPESDMTGGGGGPQEAGEPGENPKQAELGSLGDSQETDAAKQKQEHSASENDADTQEEEPSQTSSSSEETQAGTDSPTSGNGFPDAQGGEPGQGGGFGGGGFSLSGGSDLAFIDKDPSSYPDIFDNAVFDVTEADKQRVVDALEHLDTGEDLERYFDVDEILRYFAANTAMVNLDSYVGMMQHNYYLYEKDGKISVLPWDYNLSFGAFQSGSASDAVNFPIDTPVASNIEMEDRPLLNQLLAVEEYKEKYHQYLQEIVTNYFDSGLFELTITKLDALISSYVKEDATAFYTYEEYQTAIEELKEYGALRAESIRGQLDGSIPSTWAGQQEDSSALVDASSIDLNVMGMQGGGNMGGGPGSQQDENFSEQSGQKNDRSPSSDSNGESEGADLSGSGEEGQASMEAPQTSPEGSETPTGVPSEPTTGNASGTPNSLGDSSENASSSSMESSAGGDPSVQGGANRPGEQDLGINLDQETLQQVRTILQSGGTGRELTQEQKNQLFALGITEEQIQTIQDSLGNRRMPGMNSSSGQTAISAQAWWILGICVAAMAFGLLFVIFFRRRRYH